MSDAKIGVKGSNYELSVFFNSRRSKSKAKLALRDFSSQEYKRELSSTCNSQQEVLWMIKVFENKLLNGDYFSE